MKILIIEDEHPNFIHLLKLLQNDEMEIIVEGPLKSIQSVKQYFDTCGVLPDIILADIRLPDGMIFNAFEAINLKIPVIFTTAYCEYVLKVFKYNSIDYLLKPIKKEDLWGAIAKFIDNKRQQIPQLSTVSMLGLQSYRKRLICIHKDSRIVVGVDRISHIYTENKNVRVFTKEKNNYLIENSLEDLSEQLNPKEFIRVNRQYIVNVHDVQGYSTSWDRKTTIKLISGPSVKITVGKEKLPQIKKWLDQ